MRTLCIFLVLVNVAYFLWQTRTQENVANVSIDASTASLALLSELPSNADSKLSNNINTNQSAEVILAASVNTPIPTEISVAPTEAPTVVPVQAPTMVQICVVLGGFVDQSTGEQAVGFLSERGIASKLNMLEMQGKSSYLVYLPPFQSHTEALTKLHELKANGIDSFIIADGDRMNGISLGVFAKEVSANKLQTQLKDKGYSSSIANSSRITRQYNLRIANLSEGSLTESLRTELSQKYAEGKLTRTDVSCSE